MLPLLVILSMLAKNPQLPSSPQINKNNNAQKAPELKKFASAFEKITGTKYVHPENSPASSCSCQVYLDLEQDNPCGPQGAFLREGYSYCQLFLDENVEDYTPVGREFIKDVRYCLEQKAIGLPEKMDCKKRTKATANSHRECYAAENFCQIPLSDKIQILNSIGLNILKPPFVFLWPKILLDCAKNKKS